MDGLKAKFIPELIWLPTYIAIVSLINNKIYMLLLVVLCRPILECIYTLVLGEKRHEVKHLAIAFVVQCVLWCGVGASRAL